MFELIATIIFTAAITAGGYLYILWEINDFRLPELDLFRFKRPDKPLTILSVYPHPDDETMNVGGTLFMYSAQPNTRVVSITATHGEAGETNGVCDPTELAGVRATELKQALSELSVHDVRVLNFPDGSLDQKADELKVEMARQISEINPDVIFTYDSSGLYGHPDHIVLSLILQELVQTQFTDIKIFYSTLPAKTLQRTKLPERINLYGTVVEIDKDKLVRTLPEYRVSYWRNSWRKVRAIKAHRSQNISKHIPMPLWLYGLTSGVEYFSED